MKLTTEAFNWHVETRRELVPPPRSFGTTALLMGQHLNRFSATSGAYLTSAALTVLAQLKAALYGPKLTARVPALVMGDWSANPELIRKDVYIARCEVAAMWAHPWLNHVAEKLPGTAPVLLGACLTCGWEGHQS